MPKPEKSKEKKTWAAAWGELREARRFDSQGLLLGMLVLVSGALALTISASLNKQADIGQIFLTFISLPGGFSNKPAYCQMVSATGAAARCDFQPEPESVDVWENLNSSKKQAHDRMQSAVTRAKG